MRTLHVIGWCALLMACGLDSGDGRNQAGVSGGTGGVGGGDVCGLPFEVGPCDAAFQVWAFVPTLGACFPHTWGGCGGNGNRFNTRAECEAVCPVPDVCSADRVFREICLQCGVPGGCAESVATCARPCDQGSDCESTTSVGCFDGVCQVGGCI